MIKQFVYVLSVVAILVVAYTPVLRAEEIAYSLVLLDFEDLTDGTVYNKGDEFSTSIATVTVEDRSGLPGGGGDQDPNQFVNISATNFAGGSGIELGEIRNANLDFNFGTSVSSLGFSFYQGRRDLSLCVNGEMVNFKDFKEVNNITIGGAAVSVTSNDPNQGRLNLTGTIYSFKVGGGQLWIDDMFVMPAGITTYYVDVDGDDNNPGLNKETAFATIQKAILTVRPNEIVAVYPGTYIQSFSFVGKPLTLQAVTEPPVIQSPDHNAVTFIKGDGRDTIMQNFIIENSKTAILCIAGSPTIRNITFVGNELGISVHESSTPDIYNCIFWYNTNGDVAGYDVSYCCSQQLLPGLGNISTDPMFVLPADVDDNSTPNDPNDDFFVRGDYHLKSAGWRWSESPQHGSNWYYDQEDTSRCIDAGIPSYGLNAEPQTVAVDPDNEWGINIRVNMGAYGGTAQASMPPHNHAFLADINNDGFVNGDDLLIITADWLETDTYLPADLSRDGNVNLSDLSLFGSQWSMMNEWAMKISFTEYWPLEVFSRWQSQLVDGFGFNLEVTDSFVVNGIKVWEFTNNHTTSAGPVKQIENRFYLDGIMYSVQDPNHLETLPFESVNYKPLFMESMVSGTSFEIEDLGELTPIRSSLASAVKNSNLSVRDFPDSGNNDVLTLYKDYGLPSECVVAIFGKGVGPLYIASDFTEKRIMEVFYREQ